MARFQSTSPMPVSAAALFAWHARPGALQRLMPPWQGVDVLESADSLEPGTRTIVRVPVGPFRVRWVAEHRNLEPGRGFDDVQVEGPFASWHHRHRMHPDGSDKARLEDDVAYELPLGWLGAALGGRAVRRRIERTFRYRHEVTARDLTCHGENGPSLHVALTGASGFVGSSLHAFLTAGGHTVTTLERHRHDAPGDGPTWDPQSGAVTLGALDGADAVVHLAGEPLMGGRWTAEKKARIRRSREEATRLLALTLAGLDTPPRVLVCASAVGWYGDRGDVVLTEDAPPGEGFLASVCRGWEAATAPARAAGIRVVNLRLGSVFRPDGGALAQLLPLYRAGLGGRLADGRAWLSWISMDDLLGVVHRAIVDETLEGPVNAVAPEPVRHATLARTLARVMGRWAVLPAPAFALRAVFGEAADEMLLASARVVPARLEAAGHAFVDPTLEGALRHGLGIQASS